MLMSAASAKHLGQTHLPQTALEILMALFVASAHCPDQTQVLQTVLGSVEPLSAASAVCWTAHRAVVETLKLLSAASVLHLTVCVTAGACRALAQA